MGSILVVFLLLAAGVLVGRIAGRSIVKQQLMALFATVWISIGFLVWVWLTH